MPSVKSERVAARFIFSHKGKKAKGRKNYPPKKVVVAKPVVVVKPEPKRLLYPFLERYSGIAPAIVNFPTSL